MLVPYAAVTLAKLKTYLPAEGNELDAFLEDEISRWTREVEEHLGRRLVYRAPGDDAQNDNIVASASYATGALTVANQPADPGRTMIVTFPSTASAGTVTITGTVAGVVGATEVFSAANVATGSAVPIQHGVKFFTAISAIAVAAAAGGGNIKIGSSAGYTEFHSPPSGSGPRLRSLEYPIRQVAALYEDTTRVYGVDSLLVEGTGFYVNGGGFLTRNDATWPSGFRSVRYVYSAGFFTADNVPPEIQSVVLELIAWSVRFSQAGRQGQASGTDGTGSFVLSGPPFITDVMAGRLRGHKRQGTTLTAERDFDEWAA